MYHVIKLLTWHQNLRETQFINLLKLQGSETGVVLECLVWDDTGTHKGWVQGKILLTFLRFQLQQYTP